MVQGEIGAPRKKRILVIDADPREGAWLAQQTRGHAEVRTALSAEDGLSVALKHAPDLVLVNAALDGAGRVVDAVKGADGLDDVRLAMLADRWDVQHLAAQRRRPRRADRFLNRPLDVGGLLRWLSGEAEPEDSAAQSPRLETMAREIEKLRKDRERFVRAVAEKDRKIQALEVRIAGQAQVRAEMAHAKESLSHAQHEVHMRDETIAELEARVAQLGGKLEAAVKLGQEMMERARRAERDAR